MNGLVDTRRTVMTGSHARRPNTKNQPPVSDLRFTDSFLEALERCDGMTRERATVPTRWAKPADDGAAVRLRGFRCGRAARTSSEEETPGTRATARPVAQHR